MPSLRPDTYITLDDGTSLKVLAFIASGGQGEVYRTLRTSDKRPMALKWYTAREHISGSALYDNLVYNRRQEPPSEAFIWPEAIAPRQLGSFGYAMRLLPTDYLDLGKFFCIDRYPDAYFRNWLPRLTAAIKICDAFSRLHKREYCYQDVNDGSFMINPETGDVLICDTDNIVVNGSSTGIIGKPHYMAPEVAAGAIPNTASDRLSLAIVLYRLFMLDHPFEGHVTAGARYACLVPSEEVRLYGRDAVFCYDRTDASNRPVAALHPNSIAFWTMIPALLRDTFCEALSRRAILEPERRLPASRWKAVMLRVRALSAFCCHHGEFHDYLCDETLPSHCPRCPASAAPEAQLSFDGKDLHYRLTPGKPFFLGDSFTPVGFGVLKSSLSGRRVMALQNSSEEPWVVRLPSGSQYALVPEASVELVNGMVIDLGRGILAYVINVNNK